MSHDMSPSALTPLQPLVYPEAGICTEPDLYVRTSGAAGYSATRGHVEFGDGGMGRFDTYFNLFSVGKWVRDCGLSDLRLVLEGEGRFELSVTQVPTRASFERFYNELVTLEADQPFVLDLSDTPSMEAAAFLYFELRSIGGGRLTSGGWMTAQPPLRRPDLVVSITTYRREEAVRDAARRFESFAQASRIRDHLHLLVVDNGRSAEIEASAHVTPIGNENYGGAGGFTRGLLEARERGASHCLFMDDDAQIHMSTIERAWTYLAYATDESTAICGALARGADKWAIWENGATFEGHCHRFQPDLDMRHVPDLVRMEAESFNFPPNFYGGWWFFAFPLAHVRHLPFPFFVRGDDISFSLANEFRLVTLPGVIAFQESDFTDKLSPLSDYLDLRNHLVHHLSLPKLDAGALRTARIVVWFFARSMSFCRYESLTAQNMAIEDVMAGPAFFAKNADLRQRRSELSALTRTEKYYPHEGPLPKVTPQERDARRSLALLMKFTFNGHMLPGFRLFASKKVLTDNEQGLLFRVWGGKQITHINRLEKTSKTLVHSKSAALGPSLRMIRNLVRFLRIYGRLKADWQRGYGEITTDAFWRPKLAMPARNAAE
jgi:GT2 family glycosyltransferase